MLAFFAIIILFTGTITSYSDIKYGKIKNSHLLIALTAACILYLFSIIFDSQSTLFLVYPLIFSAASLIIGFVLWYFGILGGGDAKLFAVYSFITPISVYKMVTVSYAPFLEIAINAFTIGIAYLFIHAILKTTLKQKIKSIKEIFSIKSILLYILMIFGLSWVLRIAFAGIFENLFMVSLAIYLIYFLLYRFLSKYTVYILGAICILRMVFENRYISSVGFLKEFAALLAIYIIVFRVLNGLISKKNEKIIKVKELKKDLVIEGFIEKKTLKKSMKIKIPFKKPLTQAEVVRIKKLHSAKKLFFSEVVVSERIAFAPFLFAGELATVISSGNLIFFLKSLF
ncbi:prepilin peptidase [Candidatus Woesearchaeota archaeon]|nr:prepilin peptidase [Candidatus Woesearchaeota archaeon]